MDDGRGLSSVTAWTEVVERGRFTMALSLNIGTGQL